jgi:hypothetical protein
MTSTTTRRALYVFALAVAVAALPAIYVRAQTDGSSGGWMGRMISGCGGMMGRGMMSGGTDGRHMGQGMMRGGMMGGGMMGGDTMGGMIGGGERPNQQWRR